MYLSVKDFKTIENALKVINYDTLSDDDREKVISADCVLMKLIKQRKESNSKIAQYIAEKRKINKNYAR